MKLVPIIAAVLFSAAAVCAQDTPTLLSAAEELLAQVAPEHTTYRHHEPQVRWSEDLAEPAFCHTDCSGLLMALIARVNPEIDRAAFKRWTSASRPTARRFFDVIVAERGFRRVDKIIEAQPGDVIAVKYEPGGENTGHVMLIARKPERALQDAAPAIPGTEQWLVRVIDESKSGHGLRDTRRLADGQFRGGLGSGDIRLYARPDGTVAGYTWSTFANSKFVGENERVLAIGRYDPTFRP